MQGEVNNKFLRFLASRVFVITEFRSEVVFTLHNVQLSHYRGERKILNSNYCHTPNVIKGFYAVFCSSGRLRSAVAYRKNNIERKLRNNIRQEA